MKSVLIAALAFAATANAGVIGASVDVSAQYLGIVIVDAGVKTIDGSVEYPAGVFGPAYSSDLSVQITDTQLILSLNGAAPFFNPAVFNGFEIAFLTGTITGAVADISSTLNPVVSIIGNNLFLNYQGIDTQLGQASIIDLTGTGAGTSTPEPATVSFLAGGLAVVALLRRRVRA